MSDHTRTTGWRRWAWTRFHITIDRNSDIIHKILICKPVQWIRSLIVIIFNWFSTSFVQQYMAQHPISQLNTGFLRVKTRSIKIIRMRLSLVCFLRRLDIFWKFYIEIQVKKWYLIIGGGWWWTSWVNKAIFMHDPMSSCSWWLAFIKYKCLLHPCNHIFLSRHRIVIATSSNMLVKTCCFPISFTTHSVYSISMPILGLFLAEEVSFLLPLPYYNISNKTKQLLSCYKNRTKHL